MHDDGTLLGDAQNSVFDRAMGKVGKSKPRSKVTSGAATGTGSTRAVPASQHQRASRSSAKHVPVSALPAAAPPPPPVVAAPPHAPVAASALVIAPALAVAPVALPALPVPIVTASSAPGVTKLRKIPFSFASCKGYTAYAGTKESWNSLSAVVQHADRKTRVISAPVFNGMMLGADATRLGQFLPLSRTTASFANNAVRDVFHLETRALELSQACAARGMSIIVCIKGPIGGASGGAHGKKGHTKDVQWDKVIATGARGSVQATLTATANRMALPNSSVQHYATPEALAAAHASFIATRKVLVAASAQEIQASLANEIPPLEGEGGGDVAV